MMKPERMDDFFIARIDGQSVSLWREKWQDERVFKKNTKEL